MSGVRAVHGHTYQLGMWGITLFCTFSTGAGCDLCYTIVIYLPLIDSRRILGNEIPHVSIELHMSVAAHSNTVLILTWMSAADGNHSLLPAKDETLDGETAYGIVAWLL